jgi:hypothetical protein
MPDDVHENIHTEFMATFADLARDMGMDRKREIRVFGAARRRSTSNDSSKEPDNGMSPKRARLFRQWPTLALEIGFSQSLPSLRSNARWWLQKSNNITGKVNIVLIFCVRKSRKLVYLEQWEMTTPPPSQRRTRSSAPNIESAEAVPVPACVKEIDITATEATGQPLVLGFEKLFLRPPVGQEGDFIFYTEDLVDLSEGL